MSHVHLIGIGGAGLSAIATVLLQQNHTVSGSDQQASANTERLLDLGATVHIGHRPENLPDEVDVVIVSSAIPADNPELVEAQRRGLAISKRAAWLGQMMQGYTGIGLAGTHGKTTTTAMTAFILKEAGLDPTYIIGGFVPQLDSNAAAGQGDAFVIEADEYDHTFLGLRPTLAVVTTVEWDHPDVFSTPQAVTEAFIQFVKLVPPQGRVIGCGDEDSVRAVLAHAQAGVVAYGLQPDNDWQAVEIEPNEKGGHDFKIKLRMVNERVANKGMANGEGTTDALPSADSQFSILNSQFLPVSLALPGLHNVNNALAALIVATEQGVPLPQAAEILGRFRGVGRRFELKGEVNGITVIDDYAHHPTEIKATLAAARTRFGERPLWVAAQPHTFSRTLSLLEAFAGAFSDANHVILLDIFASREKDEGLVSSRDILERMQHPDARHIGPLADAAEYLTTRLAPGDVLLTFGAGDSYRVGEMVLEGLSAKDDD